MQNKIFKRTLFFADILKVNEKNGRIQILPLLRCFGFLTIYFQNIFVGETKPAPVHPHFCYSRFPWSGTVPYVCLDFGVADPDLHRSTLLCCGFVSYYFFNVHFMSHKSHKKSLNSKNQGFSQCCRSGIRYFFDPWISNTYFKELRWQVFGYKVL